ncbi:MAG TPA: hypothetical protein VFU46_07280 [Gemmatimonadales bacterium]|nr:hypothetical protein [Gemmatimonadales bacterium]
MEGLVVSVLLYACFALIVYGAWLAFPEEPRVAHRHWSGVVPGDTVLLHGEERHVVEIDFDHDAVRIDRAFDPPPIPGDWVVVRHQPA